MRDAQRRAAARARGGASRGATGPIPLGRRLRRRPRHARPPTGGSGGSRQKSGCCASAVSARRAAASTTSCRCRRRLRSAQLVRLAHRRWAIEQHYQDLKTELGLDHFEGRSYPGWQHHMVISAVAFAFSRTNGCGRARGPRSRFRSRALRTRDLYGAAVFQSSSLHAVDEASRTTVSSTADLTNWY